MATKKTPKKKRALTKAEYKRLMKAYTNYRDVLGKLMTNPNIDDRIVETLLSAHHKLSWPRKIWQD